MWTNPFLIYALFLFHSKRYPPYSESNMKFLSNMLKERATPNLKYLPYFLTFGLGIASVFAVKEIAKVRMYGIYTYTRIHTYPNVQHLKNFWNINI